MIDAYFSPTGGGKQGIHLGGVTESTGKPNVLWHQG
jgi:hypothetical protein